MRGIDRYDIGSHITRRENEISSQIFKCQKMGNLFDI